jgi:hypothetical protein
MIRIEGKIVGGEGDIEERFIRPSDLPSMNGPPVS